MGSEAGSVGKRVPGTWDPQAEDEEGRSSRRQAQGEHLETAWDCTCRAGVATPRDWLLAGTWAQAFGRQNRLELLGTLGNGVQAAAFIETPAGPPQRLQSGVGAHNQRAFPFVQSLLPFLPNPKSQGSVAVLPFLNQI
ncbi:hypothetical protein QR98_0104430 [Sarcoptes scabiei]|uniref:Uncharacterized protein n=1 Tax=Sarcoptes scabiei TaxID=52283 RepID=A0A132ALM0_SARSC|nr:hypothetical protein QR98_0104430 [Sarcoptes scabiei]